MKQSNDKQIESLLRTLGTSPRASFDSATVQQTEHLDADEMNAFAEGQLPDRTRARYVAHLADCANCRSIVASLTQTVGASSQTVAPEPAIGFWSQLKTFFSPAVLRYAIPALVLAAVAGVSFLALRQQPATDFVARNEQTPAADNRNAGQPAENSSAATTAPPATQAPVPAASVRTENEELRGSKNPAESALKPGSPTGQTGLRDLNAAPVTTTANQPLDSLYKQAEPAPPPPKPDAPVIMSDSAKEESAERQARRRENDKFIGGQAGSADSARAAAPSSGGVLSARRVQELPPSQRGYEMKRKDSEDEVRTVGGRQFRREGSAWIDTAFSTGRSTINVSRGSEHYRTLMGDEPGLRAIVEQLGGELVVVWKGKAYRIR